MLLDSRAVDYHGLLQNLRSYKLAGVRGTIRVEIKDIAEKAWRATDGSERKAKEKQLQASRALQKLMTPKTNMIGPATVFTRVLPYPNYLIVDKPWKTVVTELTREPTAEQIGDEAGVSDGLMAVYRVATPVSREIVGDSTDCVVRNLKPLSDMTPTELNGLLERVRPLVNKLGFKEPPRADVVTALGKSYSKWVRAEHQLGFKQLGGLGGAGKAMGVVTQGDGLWDERWISARTALCVRVLGSGNNAVKNATVAIAFPPEAKQLFQEDGAWNFHQEKDGKWLCDFVPDDEEFSLTVVAPGYAPHSQKLKVPLGETKELEVKLKPGPKANDPSGKPSTPKPADQLTIAGQCLDDQSRPIANAKVSLYRADLMDPLTQPLLVQSVQTDRDGKFRFARVADLTKDQEAWKRSLPQCAPYFVLAQASGKATESVFVPQHLIADSGFDADAIKTPSASASALKLSAETRNLKLRMPEGAILSGKVTAPDGKPVKGALVWAGGFMAKPIPGATSAITDSAGKFEIRDLQKMDLTKPPKGRGPFVMAMPLYVRCPGFADKRVDYSKVPGTVDVQLELEAVIQGRVVNGEDGRPAAGVRVQFQGIKEGGANGAFGIVATDAAGRYRFDTLGAGKYNIWASKDGYTMRALDSVEAVSGTTTAAADIRLVRGGFIAGHVVDADTGRPFFPADAAAPPWFRPDVALYGPSRPQSGSACDNALVQSDGSFRIRVAPGSNHIYLRIYNQAQKAVPPTEMDVDVAEGQTVTVDFKVRRKPAPETAPAADKPAAPPASAKSATKDGESTELPDKVIADPIAIAAKLTEIRDIARRHEKRFENLRVKGTFEPNHEQFQVVVRDGKYRHDREVVRGDGRRVKSYWLDDGKTAFSFSENLLVLGRTLGDGTKLAQNLPAHLAVYLTPNSGPITDRNLSVSHYCDALLAALGTEAFGKNSDATLRLRETRRRTVISIQLKPDDETDVTLDADRNYVMTRYSDRSGSADRLRQNDVRSDYRELSPGVFFLSKGTWWQKASGKKLEELGEAHEARMSIAIDAVEIGDFPVSDTFFDVHHWPPIKLGISVYDNRAKPPRQFVYDKGPFDATVLRQSLPKGHSEPDGGERAVPARGKPKEGAKTDLSPPPSDVLTAEHRGAS